MMKRLLIFGEISVLFYFVVHFYFDIKIMMDKTHFWINYTAINQTNSRNIFFLETSHIILNELAEIKLNARQCCAVESAAIMNPTMEIHLFIFTQSLNYCNNTKNYITHLSSYKNIIIQLINTDEYMKNTPLENWWSKTNVLETSYWPIVHMSDILRYVTIWKFGGIYFDLDVVIKSSFENISNFVGAETWDWIANGIFGFENTENGRRAINACLSDLMENYRGDIWNQNGPRLVTSVIKNICGTQNIREMTVERCDGIKVFSPKTFYPIYGTEWELYFNNTNKNNSMKLIDEALVIHVWNALSSSATVKVGSDVPYAIIASKYCPKIYNNCGEIF